MDNKKGIYGRKNPTQTRQQGASRVSACSALHYRTILVAVYKKSCNFDNINDTHTNEVPK